MKFFSACGLAGGIYQGADTLVDLGSMFSCNVGASAQVIITRECRGVSRLKLESRVVMDFFSVL